ncbi:MAG: hypothetical protein LUC43_10020 [Burkholderiales bacterium]|nr:hypothetical protein [Burkholderiales bacterium]
MTPKIERPAKYKNSLQWLVDSLRKAAKGNEDIFAMENLRLPAKDRKIF